jgi:hypothetical protein
MNFDQGGGAWGHWASKMPEALVGVFHDVSKGDSLGHQLFVALGGRFEHNDSTLIERLLGKVEGRSRKAIEEEDS